MLIRVENLFQGGEIIGDKRILVALLVCKTLTTSFPGWKWWFVLHRRSFTNNYASAWNWSKTTASTSISGAIRGEGTCFFSRCIPHFTCHGCFCNSVFLLVVIIYLFVVHLFYVHGGIDNWMLWHNVKDGDRIYVRLSKI